MKQVDQKRDHKAVQGYTRRDVLKTGGAAAGLAAGASLGLFGGKAPAMAQQRELHVVAWSHFIPPADEWMRGEFASEFKAATGVDLRYETINANGLGARATSAVESGSGPDVFSSSGTSPSCSNGG